MPRSAIVSTARESGSPRRKSITITRLVTSPATGRGVRSGGAQGMPSGDVQRASPMRSMAAASLTKSNSSASCASSSEKTV
eukprot:519474-Prymnesium_polylepis.1